jgi:hypothetical protein
MAAKSPQALAKQQLAKAMFAQSPRGRYSGHKATAKARGIPFLLTFEEWWLIWEASGRYSQRGKTLDSYCMCRVADAGAYTLGNVYIGTVRANLREQIKVGSNPSQILTNADHCAIIQSCKTATQDEVAKRYGVSQPYVSRLVNGKRGLLSME